MNEVYFLIKYTPFWSVPLFLLFLELAYLSKVKKKKKKLVLCLIGALFSLAMTIFYYWAGSPNKAVKLFNEALYYLIN